VATLVNGIAPSAWASYLVNGDSSGIDDTEIAQANAFAAWLGAPIVDCQYYGFKWTHDAVQFGAASADCHTYIARIENNDTNGGK
jgi:hypothetical protein